MLSSVALRCGERARVREVLEHAGVLDVHVAAFRAAVFARVAPEVRVREGHVRWRDGINLAHVLERQTDLAR